jgi:dual specificity phosphatase 3
MLGNRGADHGCGTECFDRILVHLMADFNFVTDRIATGAALSSAADVEVLIAAGINTVVDCRDDFDDGPLFAGNPAINYLWNPTPDDGILKPPGYWLRSLMFVLPLLALPGSKVLCHCAAGINRGPSTAYCVMVALSFDPWTAESLIRTARPIVGLRYAADALAACRALGYV